MTNYAAEPADVLKGGSGVDDKLFGGQGDDVLKGGSGDDELRGGAEMMFLTTTDDVLKGGSGDDVLRGGTGDDVLKGGSGDDKLIGGKGDDVLKGGSGDDVLKGGKGDDILKGGSGDDTFIYNTGDGDDTIVGGSGKDVLQLSDVTPSQFSEGWEITDNKGKSIDVADLMKDGEIDLSSIKGAGTITGPDGEEISFKSLETISLAEEPAPPPPVEPPVGEDGLVHDGKITCTIAGEAFKGNPQYAILVEGKEVARGEVEWSKDTTGEADRYEDEPGTGKDGNLHGGVGDVDNDKVVWQDVSIDYDFSEGMPKSVEIKFLNDAWGGPNNDDDDRNLIVDKISVDGLTIQSEGDFTKYGNRDGMERMSWAGTMEYNVEQAYASHLENYNQPDEPTTPPTDDRIKVGEPVEIFSTSFEMSLEEERRVIHRTSLPKPKVGAQLQKVLRFGQMK